VSLALEEQLRNEKDALSVIITDLRDSIQDQMNRRTDVYTDLKEEQINIIKQLRAEKVWFSVGFFSRFFPI